MSDVMGFSCPVSLCSVFLWLKIENVFLLLKINLPFSIAKNAMNKIMVQLNVKVCFYT